MGSATFRFVHIFHERASSKEPWVPAFAGMTLNLWGGSPLTSMSGREN